MVTNSDMPERDDLKKMSPEELKKMLDEFNEFFKDKKDPELAYNQEDEEVKRSFETGLTSGALYPFPSHLIKQALCLIIVFSELPKDKPDWKLSKVAKNYSKEIEETRREMIESLEVVAGRTIQIVKKDYEDD